MARARSQPSGTTRSDDAADARVADTIERARRLEQQRYEPNWYTRRDRFWAVLVHARDSALDRMLGAILEFARPQLGKAAYADQIWAWTAALDDVHVAFVGSIPDLREDGEYLVQPLYLPRYLMVEHNLRPGYDRFLEYDGEGIRICSRDANDFEVELPRPFAKGRRANETAPWQLLERRTGIGLTKLRGSMTNAQRAWLVLDGVIVHRGTPPPAPKKKRKSAS